MILPEQLDPAGQHQKIAAFEVRKGQAGPGIHQEVPERVEVGIAGVVGHGQAVARDLDEARRPAAVRNVDAFDGRPILGLDVAGDEEGVGAGDDVARRVIQAGEPFGERSRAPVSRIAAEGNVASLNVLRAVAEGLVHAQGRSHLPRPRSRAC